MVQDDWEPLLRAIIYVVQFDADPTRAVDRVLSQIIDKGVLGASRQAYRDALAQALASDDTLATLIPQPRPAEALENAPAQGRRRRLHCLVGQG